MKKLLLLCSLFCATMFSFAQTIQLTNSGSTTLSGGTSGSPISAYFEFMHFQVVYTAAELNAAGITGPKSISELGWYVSTAPGGGALPNYKIRMANTAATNSATHDATALTEVYSVANYTPVAGAFDMLTLNGTFIWDGTSNLLVDVCYGAAPYVSPYGEVRTYAATTTNGSRRIRADASGSRCDVATNTTNTFKPQVSLTFAAPPSCLAAGGLNATLVTSTTATVGWTAVSGATAYEYAVNTSATPPASGTNTTSTSVPVTGLASATQHYLHVRTVCGAAFSSWTTISFTTSCVATNIPYSENFDGVTAPAIPTCITVQNVNASNTWGTYSTPAAIIIGAPNSMVYAYNSTVAADDWFYTQGLNLTAGVSYRLSFKWKSNPGFPESFEVKYGSGSNAASMTAGTLYTNASAGNSTAQTQTADFIPSASGVYYIGFHCNSAADLDFLAIDDITVDLSPSCANPTGLSALPTGTGTTADLAWVAPGLGSPTGYEWAVNASATPPASGTLTTGTTANATGLTAGSTYYLHVRTECGTGTYSSWSTILFSTVVNDEACGAIPLTLGGPASCANTTTATSIADPTLPGACSSPNNTLWYSYTPSTTGTAIVRTEIPSGSSNGLSGWLAIYTATGTCPSLTLTALAGSACQSFGPTAGDVDSLTTPVLTAGTTYYFMIDGVAGDVGDFCINIIAPPAAPTCTTNISPADGATGVVISPAPSITWNAAANATSYDVYFGTVNPPTTLIGNIAATTVQITGLQYDSTYYWYIAPRNAGGAAVGCSTSVTSFTAQSIPPDCVPLTTSGCTLSDRLELFRLKGETSELNINTGTTCSATAYTDSTDHAVIIDLARGKSYWGQMKAGATGDYLTVWLDANDNGVYEDTERLMNNFAMSTSITNFNLFIPLSTAAGNHKLRARLVWYATAPTVLTTPCGNYAYSDTKDFIVNISTSGSSYVVSSYTPAGACFVGGGDIVIDSASNNNLGYVPLVDSLNALIVQVYPQGNNLGKVSASYFINTGAVRQSSTGIYYLDRNITVTATKQPVTPYNIRLPFKNSELNALIAQPGSGVTSQFDLVVTKNDNTCLSAINTVGASAALYIPTGFGTISGDYFLDFTNVTGFSSFYFHGGSTVIPINIEYFTGTKQGNNNLLDWKVSCSNTPNVTLTLERSADSRTFSAVYALTTTASRCLQPFSYTDTRALAGINYYRIKMTESNGTTSYSSIVALLNKNKGLELVNVAPNPTRGQFKLNIISSTNQKMDVVISDVQGRIIRTKSVTLTNGLNAIDMDVMNMAAGNYQVYGISAEGKTKPIKFIKQ